MNLSLSQHLNASAHLLICVLNRSATACFGYGCCCCCWSICIVKCIANSLDFYLAKVMAFNVVHFIGLQSLGFNNLKGRMDQQFCWMIHDFNTCINGYCCRISKSFGFFFVIDRFVDIVLPETHRNTFWLVWKLYSLFLAKFGTRHFTYLSLNIGWFALTSLYWNVFTSRNPNRTRKKPAFYKRETQKKKEEAINLRWTYFIKFHCIEMIIIISRSHRSTYNVLIILLSEIFVDEKKNKV